MCTRHRSGTRCGVRVWEWYIRVESMMVQLVLVAYV